MEKAGTEVGLILKDVNWTRAGTEMEELVLD
jgi:hypothetical protein